MKLEPANTNIDQDRRRYIRIILEELHKLTRATLLTCHVRNLYADYYWMFDTIGDFLYRNSLYGPLTLRQNIRRMEGAHNTLGAKYDYFPVVPPLLSQDILAGASFVRREAVKSSIRIWVSTRDVPEPQRPLAVIFLNYRDPDDLPSEAEFNGILERRYDILADLLTAVPYQPLPSHADAYRLRSVMFSLEGAIAGLLPGGRAKLETIYTLLAQRTFDLVQPRKGKNVICTLSEVDATSNINIIGSWPPSDDPTSRAQGVVDYVGRTGQFYVINDVLRYQDTTPPDEHRPPYAVYRTQGRSEIACPLIVQDRVIGVLNVEADTTDAYLDSECQMLHRLAGLAAVAMSQVTLWKDLDRAITVPAKQLVANDRRGIFSAAVEAISALGYRAAIWDVEANNWTGREDSEGSPRIDGYTNKAAQGIPVALVNLRKSGDRIVGEYVEGVLGESNLFAEWDGQPRDLPTELGEVGVKYFSALLNGAAPGEVITDIALPIFEEGDVKAVLWATARRHFLSVLNYEVWSLSLICRYTALALRALSARTERIEMLGEPRKLMLSYHFGPKAELVERLLNETEGRALEANAHHDLIVLNMDIRGSTALAQNCGRRGLAHEYAAFIAKYQRMSREAAHHHGGVFDKTMGDGVHILFNVYRDDILGISGGQDPRKQRFAALECASEIAGGFARAVADTNRSGGFGYEEMLTLGGGLAIGDGIIGGFEREITGFEYTVLGEVANRAGKLVGIARPDELGNLLAAGRLQLYRGKRRQAHRQVKEFLARIKGRSLLLADGKFFDCARIFTANPYEIRNHAVADPMYVFVLPLPRRASRAVQ